MRRLSLLLLAALCVVTRASILVAQSPSLTPFRGLIDHVSVDAWGMANYPADTWHHAISGDGRYVVFNSPGPLVANDNDNGWEDDVFLRDRTTGTTTRVSMASDGGPGNGISQYGTISANGRYVAFASGSSNLVAGDTNNHWDVFVRDLDQQTTVLVSVGT
jgi:Tol biopolymer transport system component